MGDCLFCKIVRGEIPSSVVYKDGDVLAFLDIFPYTRGHTVLVPVEHFFNFFDFPEEKMEKYFSVLKSLSCRIKIALGADGINIVQNNFAAAGQIINHLHFHIIPRWDNDGKDFIRQPKEQAGPDYLKEISEKIISAK
ncbi:MAG: HIT family protein [Spirochaetes bacterium]|jgi:histidine triad (HIT) family protein|nr:HIT family protein [Spirochaetota bacterium]